MAKSTVVRESPVESTETVQASKPGPIVEGLARK
jgi:hypothetical protein